MRTSLSQLNYRPSSVREVLTELRAPTSIDCRNVVARWLAPERIISPCPSDSVTTMQTISRHRRSEALTAKPHNSAQERPADRALWLLDPAAAQRQSRCADYTFSHGGGVSIGC